MGKTHVFIEEIFLDMLAQAAKHLGLRARDSGKAINSNFNKLKREYVCETHGCLQSCLTSLEQALLNCGEKCQSFSDRICQCSNTVWHLGSEEAFKNINFGTFL